MSTPPPSPSSPSSRGAGTLIAFASSRHAVRRAWAALSPRERRLAAAGAALAGIAVLWSLGLAPALRTLAAAPLELRRLDGEIVRMRALAAEAQELRACAEQAPPPDARLALGRVTGQRLGPLAALGEEEGQSTVTLSQAPAELVVDWLVHAREAAHAAPAQASLHAGGEGLWSGSLRFTLPAAPGPNP